jgi:uncharacterized protein (TIGR00251 family)
MNTINLEKNKIIEATVTTNAKEQDIIFINPDKYKIKVTEKPVNDKANKQIIKLFKKKGYLVEMIKGQKSSKKLIRIVDFTK